MIEKYSALQKELTKPRYEGLRLHVETNLDSLDSEIDSYVNELMEVVLPTNATVIDKAAAKKVISASVRLSIYKDRLNSLYEKLELKNNQNRDSNFNYYAYNGKTYTVPGVSLKNKYLRKSRKLTYSKNNAYRNCKMQEKKISDNLEGDKQYITEGAKLEDSYYSPDKFSPDFNTLINHRIAHNEYIAEYERISPYTLKRYMCNAPHINIVTDMKRLTMEGGRFEDLYICTEEFEKAEQAVEIYRNMLIEKQMIHDGGLRQYVEFKRMNLFTKYEKAYLDKTFISSLNRIRRVVGNERVRISAEKMHKTGDFGPFMRSSADLHSGRLYDYYKNPTELSRTIEGILGDSLHPSGVNIFSENEHTKKMRKEIHDKYRQSKPEKDSSDSKSLDFLKTAIGLIGLGISMYIVGYVESAGAVENPQKYDANIYQNPVNKIYEKNYITPSIVHADEADIIEIPDKNGKMTQIKLTEDTISVMQNILEDNYLKNQSAEMELKEETQKVEQIQKKENATRRRRVDKYKDSDLIDL